MAQVPGAPGAVAEEGGPVSVSTPLLTTVPLVPRR